MHALQHSDIHRVVQEYACMPCSLLVSTECGIGICMHAVQPPDLHRVVQGYACMPYSLLISSECGILTTYDRVLDFVHFLNTLGSYFNLSISVYIKIIHVLS